MADEIEYNIHGADTQFVEIILDPKESVVSELGAMFFMDKGISMHAVFGDGSDNQNQDSPIFNALLGAGKRLLTGEGLFMTIFTNDSNQRKKISFAAPFPGKIIPIDLAEHNGKIICQKDAFLCAAKGVAIGIHLVRLVMEILKKSGEARNRGGNNQLESMLNILSK